MPKDADINELSTIGSYIDPMWVEHGYGTRFQGFQNLMRRRIRDILIVSSLYDLYLFEEDGRLYELIRNEYQGLRLSHAPELTRVSSGRNAIAIAQEERRFDLIISTLHIEDMSALQLARMVKETGLDIPVVLLANDNRELNELMMHHDTSVFSGIFIWQGDYRLIIGIIKQLEDKMNVEHDTKMVGVQSIILIEDNVRFYSSYLPILYTELLNQSQRLISEGINLSHQYLRMRARPKILLCKTYEEAWGYFERYEEYILGIVSDLDFPRGGEPDAHAGLALLRAVRESHQDIPFLLQSTSTEHEEEIHALGGTLLIKESPTLLHQLRLFMTEYFSFGDFVFRLADGREVGRASDLRSLEQQLRYVPSESIRYHAERNHFSNWLKARTEFWLAHQLRPRKVSDYPTLEHLRQDLIRSLHEYQRLRQRGIITQFSKETFDPESSFARIGSGSLGGKARGLGFVNILLNNYDIRDKIEGILIHVPPAIVLSTEVFDRFLEENELRSFALEEEDDGIITKRFLEAKRFPEDTLGELAAFLDLMKVPLAVRSSSLLEDSQYHPFAGVYETYMIPNNHPDPFVRLGALVNTIKRVYASTFYRAAKDYIKMASYRLEEEKMAVIVQKMVGSQRENRFYPEISGVAKSHNFYPLPPQKSEDGIVSVALGLGKMIVDGGPTVRFCPKYPQHIHQHFSATETLRTSQNEFYALELFSSQSEEGEYEDVTLRRHRLSTAETDGTLHRLGSTYSSENDRLYDGISRSGTRVVTFAPILKHKLFPLPEILELLLDMGRWGMGTQVEIEFAVNLSPVNEGRREFGLLQMRPLVLSKESDSFQLGAYDESRVLCSSPQALGHGVMKDIFDIVVVNKNTFERSATTIVAAEVAGLNEKLVAARKPYILIGVGRWGSLDPWLGIPVKWGNICGARAIVEADFADIDVAPSQGSHFFQNITSFMIGYFSINNRLKNGSLDWGWLLTSPAVEETKYVRHLRFSQPVIVAIQGHNHNGLILKPENDSGRK